MITERHLHIDTLSSLKMPLDVFIGESVGVLGIKGSGKTNTAAVLIEELLSGGLPLTIVDIEGEYWGLKEKFEILVAGRSSNVDLEVNAAQAGKIAEFSVVHGISVILDLSDFTQEEMFDFLLEYFKSLWEICFTTRRPYEIVLEEAHEFVPQTIRTPLKEVLTRIALRGRKRGLGLISVSQRSAKVEKDILTQASILFLHRVVHPIDIKIYQDILPLPSKEVELMVGSLQPGQVIVLNNHKVDVVQVRLRHTFHVGATPQFDAVNHPKLRRIDKTLLKELQKLVQTAGEYEDEKTKTIKQLQDLLAKKDEEIEQQKIIIERLTLQNELLSKFELSLGTAPSESLFLSRLEALEVEKLHATHLVAEEKIYSGTGTAELVHLVATDRPLVIQANAQSIDIHALRQQQRKFESLLQDIKKLSKLHRSILRFLIEREGSAMNIKDLARWLELRDSTIRNRPPTDLLKLGLITRFGSKGGYKYSAAHRQLLKTKFPDIDLELLTERLLANC